MKIIRIDSQFVGETDRTLELKEELYDILSRPEAIDHIIDWKGHLMVYWFRIPTEQDIYFISRVWEAFGESEITHYSLTQVS